MLRMHRNELVCAAVAAGVAALFGSPLGGLLFAVEVVARKRNMAFFVCSMVAVSVACLFTLAIEEPLLFPVIIKDWHLYAIPWFAALGVLAALQSAYLTRTVITVKRHFGNISKHFQKVILGAVIISVGIMLLPGLYGDGYHSVAAFMTSSNSLSLDISIACSLLSLLILKPVLTAVTLAAGGDGGIFGPSLFIGAILGLLFALVANDIFNAGIIPLNFMVVGMAAMLSASIHAPLTAIFLICSLTGNYVLIIPLTMASLIAKFTGKAILPYTLYTYAPPTVNQPSC